MMRIGNTNYVLKKINENEFLFKLRWGEENNYSNIVSLEPEIRQELKIDEDVDLVFERHNKSDVKMFKSKKLYLNLSETEFYGMLRKDEIFLGQKLIDNRDVENDYINIDDLQRTAILGTSGGGKSNALNSILYSVFFNLSSYKELCFIDFKGGLEAQPVADAGAKLDFDIKIGSDLDSTLTHFRHYDNISKMRQQQTKKLKQKKSNEKIIFIFVDEVAELLGTKRTEKAESEQQKEIIQIWQSLFSTGRSQKIYLIYATQSFLGNASGLTSQMKINTTNKILFKTTEQQSYQSVFSQELLEEGGNLKPNKLKIGESIAITNGVDYPYKLLFPLVPDDVENCFVKVAELGGYVAPEPVLEPEPVVPEPVPEPEPIAPEPVVTPEPINGKCEKYLSNSKNEKNNKTITLKELVKIRKELWNKSLKIDDIEQKKDVQRFLKLIKKEQDSGNFCESEIIELRELYKI